MIVTHDSYSRLTDMLSTLRARSPSSLQLASLLAIAALLALLTRAHLPLSLHSPPPALEIFYWPVPGRAYSLLAMCSFACAPCSHVHAYDRMAHLTSATGRTIVGEALGDTFAPPMVVDKGRGVIISQSVAATLYLGEQLGFDRAVQIMPKAVQYMVDASDLLSQTPIADPPITEPSNSDVAALVDFHDSGRFNAWMGNLERSIKGPYYFGDSISYVDFYLTMVMMWLRQVVYDRIPGAEHVYDPYTKVLGVVEAVQALDFAKCPVNGSPMPLGNKVFPLEWVPSAPFAESILAVIANSSLA
ncbi:MAG: hypothetical protein SGPRY_008311 [Prymnesium sp.]